MFSICFSSKTRRKTSHVTLRVAPRGFCGSDRAWRGALALGLGFVRYISQNFRPLENNSVTVWIALDDADEETGVVTGVQHVPTCAGCGMGTGPFEKEGKPAYVMMVD